MAVVQQKPLKKVEIARAMGWSKSYLSQARFSGMPTFYSVDDFKAWYRATGQRGGPDGMVVFAGEQKSGAAAGCSPVVIDWTKYETPDGSHAEVTIQRCEHISNMAFGLLESAIKSGDIGAAYGCLRNWSEAMKQTAAVKCEFIELQERERKVLPLDDVMNVVGMVLQSLRSALERNSRRIAGRLCPDDPGQALEILNAGLDDVFAQMSAAESRLREALGNETSTHEQQTGT